jgi:HSP20 family protein
MPNIVRWDPFAEMDQMRQTVDRLFNEFRPYRLASDLGSEFGYVPVDISETDDEFVVKANLPGVEPEDVDVQVHGDTVTIRGEAKSESEEKDGNWLRRERRYGVFTRSFNLPATIDSAKASADFEHGVLKLTLPKSETERPKSIKVGGKKPVIEGKKT